MQGIYAIVNVVSGRRYIGSSTDIRRRWYQHVFNLKKGLHTNLLLQRAWTKHGVSGFQFVLLEEVFECHQLVTREQFHIEATSSPYNVASAICGMNGRTACEETRAKLRAAWRHRPPVSAATRAKQSASMKARGGHPVSAEAREKIRGTLSGRKLSAETRAKMSAATKGRPRQPLSAETKERLRAANLGKTQSRETIAKRMAHPSMAYKILSHEAREKIRATLMGHAVSEETRAKIRASKIGRVHSMEHRANNSLAQKRVWQRRRGVFTESHETIQ